MPFIRKVRVLFKTRLIFPSVNDPIMSQPMLQSCIALKIVVTNRESRSGLWIFCPWNSDSGFHPSAEFSTKAQNSGFTLLLLLVLFCSSELLTFEFF